MIQTKFTQQQVNIQHFVTGVLYLCKTEVNSLISMSEKKCHYFCTGVYMNLQFRYRRCKYNWYFKPPQNCNSSKNKANLRDLKAATGLWSGKAQFGSKIGYVLYRVTLKFDGWAWKRIRHLSFAVSSFVRHFIAIGEFKLELQSGNAQFGSNSTIFRAVWPWNLTYDLEKQ